MIVQKRKKNSSRNTKKGRMHTNAFTIPSTEKGKKMIFVIFWSVLFGLL